MASGSSGKFAEIEEQVLSPASSEYSDRWLSALPSKSWTERYDGGWDDVQKLMAASRREAKRQQDLETKQRREAEERAREEKERTDQLAGLAKQLRYVLIAAAVSTLVALVATGVAIWRWY